MEKTHTISLYFLCLTLVASFLISGCGKNEAAGGAVGGASGALLGAAVSGSHSRGTGALIGGLAGTLLGSTIGRSADDEEKEEEQEYRERKHAQETAQAQHELDRVKQENRMLKQKWCSHCNREVTLAGAQSCPSCGGQLIHERYCRECMACFSPQSGYRYCPYCKNGQQLCAR